MKVEWQRTGSVGKSLGDDILSSAHVGRKAGRKAGVVSEQQAPEDGWMAPSDGAIMGINENQ